MAGHIALLLRTRVSLARPALRDLGTKLSRAWSTTLWPRLAGLDLAAVLIRFADRIEAGCGLLWRGLLCLRHLRVLLRVPGLRLTGGLAWRSLAAATGIGLTAVLVTALPSESVSTPASPSLASIQETRPARDVRQETRSRSAGREDWVVIARPLPMFGLESPDLDRASATLLARRSPDGLQREDVLGFGAFAEPKPHLVLRLGVEHGGHDLARPFLIATVRDAASHAMSVQRSSLPAPIQTRFGPVEAADATLGDGQISRPCIVFRREAGELPLAISGWWCGTTERPADRRQLVCLIDRIDLLNAGDDRALRSAFARTELARQPGCAPPRLSASGRKVSWLDADGPTPALRTKTATVTANAARRSEKR